MTAPRTFDELGLPAPLQQAIDARGLTAPTQVQVLISDPELAGHDLLVSSQTGSGKTLAFGFLIARELIDDTGKFARSSVPAALVVAPTRELAVQVQRELEWVFEKTGARVMSVTGGSDAREEARKLKRGTEILVATPGRLIDHLDRKNVDLSGVKVAVLDEADEMLDLGFRDDLERILKSAPKERRTHLFSATLPSPILKLAATYQRGAKRIAAGVSGGKAGQHQDIEYIAHVYGPGQREAAVVNVLRRHDASAAIVFTKTRAGAGELGAALSRRGFTAVPISGDLTQSERTRALASLRDGRARVLVATDVAARGLDLPDVALVVHADPPMEASGITHRSGRTGRAGKKGVSVLLCSRNDKVKLERMMAIAGVKASWTPLPTADEIARADRERIVEGLKADAKEPDPFEAEMVDLLLKEVPVRDLVAALVRRTASALPAPVKIVAPAPGAARTFAEPRESGGRFDRHDRTRAPLGRSERPDRGARDDRPGGPRPERPKKQGYVAFRVNVGHDRNAEPRWLLPLICRRGGVTGGDVGSIDIRPRSTTFEIRETAAEAFEKSALVRDPQDPGVRFARELSRAELDKFEAISPRAPRAEGDDGERRPPPRPASAKTWPKRDDAAKPAYVKRDDAEKPAYVKRDAAEKPAYVKRDAAEPAYVKPAYGKRDEARAAAKPHAKPVAKAAPRKDEIDDGPARPPKRGAARAPEGYDDT